MNKRDQEKTRTSFNDVITLIRKEQEELYKKSETIENEENYPRNGSVLTTKATSGIYNKELLEEVFKALKLHVEQNPVDIVLNKFTDGLKSGEFGRFSDETHFFVFDSFADIKEEKLTVKVNISKQRKIDQNLKYVFLPLRQQGKTVTTKEYNDGFIDKEICTTALLSSKHLGYYGYDSLRDERVAVPTQDDFPYAENDGVDQSKAEFKKSPLERLNKKKAVKTASVSPLLKGLMGKN